MPSCRPNSATSSPLRLVAPERGGALRQTVVEHAGRTPAFYDAAFPGSKTMLLDQFEFTALRRAPPGCSALLLTGERLLPGRGVAPASRPDSGAASLDMLIEPAV